jgi:hypothetical protein
MLKETVRGRDGSQMTYEVLNVIVKQMQTPACDAYTATKETLRRCIVAAYRKQYP